MKDPTQSQAASPNSKVTRRDAAYTFTKKRRRFIYSWESYVKLICGIAIIMLLTAIVVKLVRPTWLTGGTIETLLVALAVAILIPYVSNFEALGVKVAVREKVEELSAWAKASPYYTLGSEYEVEGDLILAEQYYLKSLQECPTFWPSLFGLGSVYHESASKTENPDEYSKAISHYHRVLELDEDNIYSYNNLAAIYVNGPRQIRNAEKALDCANKALEIIPSFYDASYYKGVALNNLNSQESYLEAHDTLQGIMDAGGLQDYKHWVMYELNVSKSNLGNAITLEDIEQMFDCAKYNEGDDRLLEILSRPEEQERFKPADLPNIRQFLKDHMKQREG